MALGVAQAQQRFENPRAILGKRLRAGSIYRLLADEGGRLFPDDYFADLHKASALGRPTVPARTLATVMTLQAFEGLRPRGRRPPGGRPALAGRRRGRHRRRVLPLDGAGGPAQPPAGVETTAAAVRGHQGGGQGGGGAAGPGPGAGLHRPLRRGGHPGHRHPAARGDPQAAGGPRQHRPCPGRPSPIRVEPRRRLRHGGQAALRLGRRRRPGGPGRRAGPRRPGRPGRPRRRRAQPAGP